MMKSTDVTAAAALIAEHAELADAQAAKAGLSMTVRGKVIPITSATTEAFFSARIAAIEATLKSMGVTP